MHPKSTSLVMALPSETVQSISQIFKYCSLEISIIYFLACLSFPKKLANFEECPLEMLTVIDLIDFLEAM